VDPYEKTPRRLGLTKTGGSTRKIVAHCFHQLVYIAAATDNMSLQKALSLENSLASEVLFCKLASTLYKYLLSNEMFFPSCYHYCCL